MVPVDLAGVASSATARLTARFVEKGVDLAVSFSPTVVRGDAHRLEQVAVNLLSNAVKFTPSGGKVTITVDRDAHRGRLVVSDTGRGIPVDEQDHVFERFYRGSRSTDTFGTGVGLAVVAALVTAHGGDVALESHSGFGTTFTVSLPLA
jgi:signal transduction histidine kinase